MSERSRTRDLAVWIGGQLKGLRASVAALQQAAPQTRTQTGTTTVLLALGGSIDVPVTWTTPLPDANYLCWAVPTGSSAVPLPIKSQTAAGCVVTVRASVALAAGFPFRVYAVRIP